MTGTKRCDRCWELETRIKADLNLARKIVAKYTDPNTQTSLVEAAFTIETIAEEIDCFRHSARAHSLRITAKAIRREIISLKTHP